MVILGEAGKKNRVMPNRKASGLMNVLILFHVGKSGVRMLNTGRDSGI
jgi:hypothetical protein